MHPLINNAVLGGHATRGKATEAKTKVKREALPIIMLRSSVFAFICPLQREFQTI